MFIIRVCACLYMYVWGSHHLPRRGMSDRTECGEPSVTIAHRGIFTPTLALSRNPSIPILHTLRRLITVTSPAYFLLKQYRGFPERICVILLGVVYFLLLGKSLGCCEKNAGPLARKLSIADRHRSCAFYDHNGLLRRILR